MSDQGADRALGGSRRETYHHGTLREALIRATDEILSEQGPDGFTLREAARRARVSPSAPAHHFGSAAGLLTEVAIAGFEGLTRGLREAAASELDPAARLSAQGMSYVRFALAQPGRFQLMFRKGLLLPADERLNSAGKGALAELEASVRAYLAAGGGPLEEQVVRALVLGVWSAVHGFAHLALDGKFTPMAHPRSIGEFVAETLPEVLSALLPGRPGL